MIVYSSTKAQFQADIMKNDIGNIIHSAYRASTGRTTGKSEVDSWMNSLQYMDRVLTKCDIPEDVGVAIEYHLPQTSKRIDFILTGKDAAEHETAILIELKQWQSASLTQKDAVVLTRFKHGEKETPHPSYQAWSYKRLLEDFNQTVQDDKIQLFPCAYLHNYEQDNVITNNFYAEHISKAPIFLKSDALKLCEFIKAHVKYGDKNQLMYRIDGGKIRPSKNLADQLASMLRGNEEFIMIDDQKIVFETAIALALKSTSKNKNVLIIEGGPGTGKSVVAINLLVALTNRELVTQYVTRNSAPRVVYEAKLTNSFKKSHISNMFSSSGAYHSAEPNIFDCLIVDEAHRLNEKSGMFSHLGENQILELIKASKLSVFFVDEDQKVTIKDIGDKEQILRWAKDQKAAVTQLKLESQFRCNGSDGYLAWLDNTLQVRNTANQTLESINYDFKIMDNPSELHALIRNKNKEKNKARMVAGYCWKWISKKNPILKDIVIDDYKATWNLDTDGQAWIIQSDSVNEVGCIHTCQGLEVDYVGVIIGPDLVVRDGKIITRPEERASTDKSIHGWKSLLKQNPEETKVRLDGIIKNTYRTLMTRGQKGCFVYSVDPETNRYLKEAALGIKSINLHKEEQKNVILPFRILNKGEIKPYVNTVPIFDLKIAAGNFSDEQPLEECEWGELPEPFIAKKGFFIAQVIGESMNRRIPNGSWCLFKSSTEGSRNGKIVLVQHRKIQDADNLGRYTVKIYESQKITLEDTWKHQRITLRPDSRDPSFKEIHLNPDEAVELSVIGEFVAVLGI